MRRLLLVFLGLLSGLSLTAGARADDDVLRYVSLDTDKAYMRTGPGLRYPVEWVFVRDGWPFQVISEYGYWRKVRDIDGWPFQVISEYGYWRKVRDIDGTAGWMHMNLLTSKRRVIVTGDVENVYKEPDAASRQVAILEKGVVADLRDCKDDWCQVSIRDADGKIFSGWMQRAGLWGAEDKPE